jgi:hypothetical protein
MTATLVIVLSTGFPEKCPNTYPTINTILATNNNLNKINIPKYMILNFMVMNIIRKIMLLCKKFCAE